MCCHIFRSDFHQMSLFFHPCAELNCLQELTLNLGADLVLHFFYYYYYYYLASLLFFGVVLTFGLRITYNDLITIFKSRILL